ncbi:heparinase II/III family protein [Paenibacillus sp. LHD-38]|uniref:heparinase II/III family protein n=1 Tax=Paenibacillus sp. LHD-38 TaxID=3072143 RepID=UPI00280FFD6D|nr:heparinase II/III family protein [Paenibacillus sp. LHD-38]MDQ8735091.1 heparinase II/III family protein [Paenibacillus sp. LHD-38]
MKRKLIKDILEHSRKRGLALLTLDSAVEGLAASLLASEANRSLLDEIKAEADRFVQTPDPELTYTLFRIYGDSGERLAYERVYFERRKRLNAFVIMALLEPDRQHYESAALNMIWSICNEYTWCLPAHFNEDAEKPDIDLFAAETGYTLSEVLLLLGDRLPALLRERIEGEIEQRLFRPFLKQGPYGWETAEHNWSAVCAGSIGAAALHLIEDTGRLSELLERVLESLDCYLSGFGEDGACAEGYLYWQYGFGYYVYFAKLLQAATDGRIDLFASHKVKEIALFQQKCFTGGGTVVNFSDSTNESGIFMGLSCCLHNEYNEVIVPDGSLRAKYSADHCGRWAPALRNLIWVKDVWMQASDDKTLWPAESYYLSDVQWLLSRHVSENGGSYSFAAKGGHNEEPHNHNDVGHFILHADGQAYLADLGSGKYTAQYFGPERYSIWCNGSQGHSVPVINGLHQQNGSSFRATVLEASTDEKVDQLMLAISGAYGQSQLERLERHFRWEKERLPRLNLNDLLLFADSSEAAEQHVTERFITFLAPELVKEGHIVLSGKRQLSITYDHQIWRPTVTARSDLDHFGNERFWYTLDFEAAAPAGMPLTASFIFQFES